MKYLLIWRLLGAVLLLASTGNTWAQGVVSSPAQGGSNPAAALTLEQPASGTAQGSQRQVGYIDLVAGLAYTSNAFLTSSSNVGSGIAVVGTSTDYGYQGADLTANVLGTVSWVEYLHRAIDDESSGQLPAGASRSIEGEPYGQLAGTALLGQPTDPFQWQLSDGFGEQMANPLAAPTPQAREWVNYVTTGPDINVNFALRDRLTLFGQYSRTTYQTSPFDSQGYNAGAVLTHGLSAVSALSLLVATAHTGFLKAAELAIIPSAIDSYDIRTATLGYNAAFARTRITASAGYNTVSSLVANSGGSYPRSTQGRPTGALQLSHQVSPFSSLYLKGQDAYQSSGSSLLSPPAGVAASAVGATPAALTTVLPTTQAVAGTRALSTMGTPIATGVIPQAGFGVVSGVAAAAPFEERAGTLGWAFQYPRTGLSLAATAMQQRFLQQSTFDLNAWIASAGWLRQITPTLSFQLQGFGSFYHFTQLHADTHSSIASITFAKQLARVTFSAYAEWLHQSSSVPPGVSLPIALYSDEIVGVNVSYDLIGRHLTGGQSQTDLDTNPGSSTLPDHN